MNSQSLPISFGENSNNQINQNNINNNSNNILESKSFPNNSINNLIIFYIFNVIIDLVNNLIYSSQVYNNNFYNSFNNNLKCTFNKDNFNIMSLLTI